jgi:hypothetical protein
MIDAISMAAVAMVAITIDEASTRNSFFLKAVKTAFSVRSLEAQFITSIVPAAELREFQAFLNGQLKTASLQYFLSS